MQNERTVPARGVRQRLFRPTDCHSRTGQDNIARYSHAQKFVMYAVSKSVYFLDVPTHAQPAGRSHPAGTQAREHA